MTDKEIIKGCDGCPHKIGINHYRRKAQNQKQELRRLNEKVAEQQAVIERYEEDIERLRTALIQEVTDRDAAKAEAIKECLEWVLSLFPEDKNFTTISRFTINQRLKEMVGEDK